MVGELQLFVLLQQVILVSFGDTATYHKSSFQPDAWNFGKCKDYPEDVNQYADRLRHYGDEADNYADFSDLRLALFQHFILVGADGKVAVMEFQDCCECGSTGGFAKI